MYLPIIFWKITVFVYLNVLFRGIGVESEEIQKEGKLSKIILNH